jgi:hypothetical protein
VKKRFKTKMNKPSLYTPNELSAFKLFTDFLTNLTEHMSENQITPPKSIALYHRLVSSVKFEQEKVFKHHISTLRTFFIQNRSYLPNMELAVPKLEFSERIYIDFVHLFKLVDSDTVNIVWDYLFNLSKLLDPLSEVTSRPEEISTDSTENRVVDNQFDDLVGGGGGLPDLSGLASGLGGGMGGANPMAILGTMMNPETMNDIMSTFNDEIESGNINLDELTNQVGTMMKQFQPIMSKLQSKLDIGNLQMPPNNDGAGVD